MQDVQTIKTPSQSLWSIILAGGDGLRMRPFIKKWLGCHVPKQYCTFVGTRSMLQHTWDRADLLSVPQQKITVVSRSHHRLGMINYPTSSAGHFLFQPCNRDTAAGVFLPLTHLRAKAPEATVIVYPSDHFVYPEELFTKNIYAATKAVEWWSDRIILLGAKPSMMELDYGWIEKKRILGWTKGCGLWSVKSFQEKPNSPIEGINNNSNWLWSTMIVVAKVKTLWELGRQHMPEILERFSLLRPAIDTRQEGRILEDIYADMPMENFSSSFLHKATRQIGVMELQNVLWSDWGRPERIVDTLKAIGRMPTFSDGQLPPDFSAGCQTVGNGNGTLAGLTLSSPKIAHKGYGES